MKSSNTNLRRISAGAATGALVASGLLLVATPAQADTQNVSSSDIAPNEDTYAGWHQGYANAPYASGISSKGLSSIGKSQIIYGYEDNDNTDLAKDGVNADLGDDLAGASYDVAAGEAYFQVPLFVDTDGDGGNAPIFTTLRPATAADDDTTISGDDQWVSSKAFGTVAANTPIKLSDLVAALSSGESVYKTIGFGVLTDAGQTSTVSSITFAGDTYAFTADDVSSTTADNSDVAVEETSNTYKKWHQGYDNATGRQQVTADGLELSGKSQVIKGYNNNSDNLTAVNANLAGAVPDASYTVTDGTAYFQIAVKFDNGNGVQFATLRNDGAGVGKNALGLDQSWQSSKAIGDIAANTDATLSDLVGALVNYKVIGYGVLTTAGSSATVSDITFGGVTTTFKDVAATATKSNVTPSALAADESTYAGWHQGAETNSAKIANDVLSLGDDRSQVINGYANNSKNTTRSNVDLAEALRTASYTVKSGTVFFQVPLFFEDANGATQFATLRPAEAAKPGVNRFHIADEWVSSKQLGDLPANTPVQLGDILSSVGSYKVLAFGVYSDAGDKGVVSDITWDGVKYTFAKVSSATTALRFNTTKPSVRSSLYVYATISSSGGAVVAGGTVEVKYRAQIIATGKVAPNGNVRINLPKKYLKAGTRDVEVRFLGTDTAGPSKAKKSITIRK